MTDIGYIKGVDIGHYSSGVTNAPAAIGQRFERHYTFVYAGDTNANTNVAAIQTGIEFPRAGILKQLYIKPLSNVALNASNYAYINVALVTPATATVAEVVTTVGVTNTAVAAVQKFNPTNMVVATANTRIVTAQSALIWQTQKPGGTGVSLPSFTITAVVEDT